MKRMVLCRDCRSEVSRSAKVCPKCGCRNPADQQRAYIVAGSIALIVGLAVAAAIAF